MTLLSTVYDVSIVNAILDTVYTNNLGVSSYSIPISEEDPQRIAFNNWLDALGYTDDNVMDVNYATATLRIYYISLFDCSNSCLCIPPLLIQMGFGKSVNKNTIFNYNTSNNCCSPYTSNATVYPTVYQRCIR